MNLHTLVLVAAVGAAPAPVLAQSAATGTPSDTSAHAAVQRPDPRRLRADARQLDAQATRLRRQASEDAIASSGLRAGAALADAGAAATQASAPGSPQARTAEIDRVTRGTRIENGAVQSQRGTDRALALEARAAALRAQADSLEHVRPPR